MPSLDYIRPTLTRAHFSYRANQRSFSSHACNYAGHDYYASHDYYQEMSSDVPGTPPEVRRDLMEFDESHGGAGDIVEVETQPARRCDEKMQERPEEMPRSSGTTMGTTTDPGCIQGKNDGFPQRVENVSAESPVQAPEDNQPPKDKDKKEEVKSFRIIVDNRRAYTIPESRSC